MGKLGMFFLGCVLGGLVTFGGQRYHLVRADDGLHVVPKVSASFTETYVDIRHYRLADWGQHRSLAAAIVMAKKDHLLQDSAASSLGEGIRSALTQVVAE